MRDHDAAGEDEKKGEGKERRTGGRAQESNYLDSMEEDCEWQMEYNQEAERGEESDEPPGDHEGMDLSEWLATSKKAVWTPAKSSYGEQEVGRQIRKRIIKQRN